MRNDVLQQAAAFSKVNRRKNCWRRIVAGLSAIVVFVTTYALILPAITQAAQPTCGYEEHSHTVECYSADGTQLVCGKTAHIHADVCYSDRTADVESEADWEATIPKNLTGEWSVDLLAVAKSQLGYRESTANLGYGTDSVVRGYTRYGAWAGDAYGDWQTAFISFCLHYAGVRTDYFPFSANKQKTMKALEASGFFMDAGDYTPQAGDLVFFGSGSSFTHVGVVTEYVPATDDSAAQLQYIQGDADNRVAPVQCAANEKTILGYAAVGHAYLEYTQQAPREKTYSDETVTVTATYFPAAGISDDAELVVKVIDPNADQYGSCYQTAFDTIERENGQILTTKIKDFRLYDICFMLNGEEIQPLWDVDIQISYPDADVTEESDVSVVHYHDDSATLPAVDKYELDDTGSLHTSFETDSFSLFAVVTSETTVDYIVSLSQFSVTSSNLTALGGNTFAIVSDGYGLTVDADGKLATWQLVANQSDNISGYESTVRWQFVRSGSTGSDYYITTQIDGTAYYLLVTDGALSLTTGQGTTFTAARSDANITLKSGSTYISLSENGATMGSSMALSLYSIPTGSYTVTFDGQLGLATYMGSSNKKYSDAEKVSKTTDADGYITLPTAEETAVPGNYPMRLNAWYDIINRVYYDSSMFGKTIKVSNNTIFYAEWIAETYDIGQNVDVVASQPDTSDFITTYVYDYTEVFNVHSTYFTQSDTDETTGSWTLDTNSELGFIFFDWINPTGNIGYMTGRTDAVNGITVNNGKGYTGTDAQFPGTVTAGIANDARMDALFGTGSFPGRHNLGEGDWLYSYDEETGYYYYNSAKNAASYNQSEQRFYVYDYTVQIDSSNSTNDFLPLNYGKTQYAEKNNEANYWFGMKSEINFYLPFDSGSGENKAANGVDDMQFRFSGDDDVWVFVDGVLALDLGGVHDRVYGEINFSTGKVRVGQATSSSSIASNTGGSTQDMPGVSDEENATGVTTYDLPMLLEGGKEHTVTLYYLERGSSLSNCSVYFNLSPLYKLEISKSNKENATNLSGAEFEIYSDAECTQPADLYWKEDNGTLIKLESSLFTTDEYGVATCWGLFSGQTYYIKEVKPPPGYADLSEYVIEFNLTRPGISKFIIIDSNGEQWEFARGYLHQSGTEHRIELDVYNDPYIGGEKELYVEKVWGDGSKDIPDEITVRLFANGNPTTRKLVLNAENDWKAFFYELPETDGDGNEIIYTVKEIDAPSGYTVSYEETVGKDSTTVVVPGYWEQVTAFTSGKTYRIVTNSQYTLQCSSSGSISRVVVADDAEDQQWVAIASGSYFQLQNKAYTTRYLTISSSSISTSTTASTTNAQLDLSSSRLKVGSKNYYLRDTGSAYRGTNQSSSAATVTLYEWVEESTTTTSVDVPGWRITNTPWSDSFSIPVEKSWDSTVAETERSPVSFGLYLVNVGNEASAQLQATLTLNASNGWSGSFTDVPYPEDGSYYCVMEHTDEYRVSYGGETVSILSDSQTNEAERVTVDDTGQAGTVQVTNAALVLLPNTGGRGVWPHIIGGIALMATAGVLLWMTHQKQSPAKQRKKCGFYEVITNLLEEKIMKSLRKILTFMLVAVMLVMSMAVNAFATDITISGGASGAQYAAYKLLNATDGGEGKFSYSLNDKYTAILEEATGKDTQAEIVEYIAGLDADGVRSFADSVYAKIKATESLAADYTSSNDTFTGVAQGYYLIAETALGNDADTYSLVMLDTAGQENVVVTTKEDVPMVEKKVLEVNDTTGASAWGDSADYDIGDAVKYTITGTVSAKYADYQNYYYSFVDTMDKGLTYNANAKIYIVNGDSKVDVTEQFVIATTQNEETALLNGFTAAANLKKLTDVTVNASSQVLVEYSCTLNQYAAAGTGGNHNSVYLEYESDPYRAESALVRALVKPESVSVTPVDVNTVFTFETSVSKIDKSGAPLAGAGFTLYKWVKEGASVEGVPTDAWVAVGDEITGVTVFSFKGLDVARYKLVETTVPDGYNKCDDIEFEIEATYDLTVDPDALTGLTVKSTDGQVISEGDDATFAANSATGVISTSVINLAGAELPGTGGIGTTIFYIIGAVLVLAAVVLLVTKRRMMSESDEAK